MPAVLILTAVPDLRTARSIARTLVRKKLAACVSYAKGYESVYRWKGKTGRAAEALLFIKTARSKFGQVERALKSAHPYELPEIIAIPVVRGSKDYLSWLNDSLR
jgi:periplasmic divalent cation tolerance protein